MYHIMKAWRRNEQVLRRLNFFTLTKLLIEVLSQFELSLAQLSLSLLCFIVKLFDILSMIHN